ncbi:MAG: hypothetical protein K0S65_6180, partial [Labilithrix sp.]|nr:hypothetical protein [Labilithrix sp.]
MKPRLLLALVTGALASGSTALVVACASDEDAPLVAPDTEAKVPASDSGADGGVDDAAPAPEPCLPDALCPNGPFDPATSGGGLDLRTRINVIRGRSISD